MSFNELALSALPMCQVLSGWYEAISQPESEPEETSWNLWAVTHSSCAERLPLKQDVINSPKMTDAYSPIRCRLRVTGREAFRYKQSTLLHTAMDGLLSRPKGPGGQGAIEVKKNHPQRVAKQPNRDVKWPQNTHTEKQNKYKELCFALYGVLLLFCI